MRCHKPNSEGSIKNINLKDGLITMLDSILRNVWIGTFISFLAIHFANAGSRYTIDNTELHAIDTSLTLNKKYQLYISTPESYTENPNRYYPVIYLLDPQWAFASLIQDVSAMVYDKEMPEVIIVGVGYPGSNPDYSRLRLNDYPSPNEKFNQNTGAPQFLNFLKTEVIPWVDSRYRTDTNFKALFGTSYGGHFALYTLFENPTLFQAYVAATPVLHFNYRELWQKESRYYFNGSEDWPSQTPKQDLPAKLYMSVGLEEINVQKAEILAFNEILKLRNYEGFKYEFRAIDNVGHGGAGAETYLRAMQFIFKDL